jgi:beta-lactam-binding protein with PASTA domain
MSFLNISVLVLASMVLILAGMVGYLYWQQNRVLLAVGTLSSFVSSQFTPPVVPVEDDESDDESDDDRASVTDEKQVEVVEKVEVPTTDVDDLETKTAPELRDLLSKKGIPYGKRDSKNVLLQLLKASS